jgi:hypothetical protein
VVGENTGAHSEKDARRRGIPDASVRRRTAGQRLRHGGGWPGRGQPHTSSERVLPQVGCPVSPDSRAFGSPGNLGKAAVAHWEEKHARHGRCKVTLANADPVPEHEVPHVHRASPPPHPQDPEATAVRSVRRLCRAGPGAAPGDHLRPSRHPRRRADGRGRRPIEGMTERTSRRLEGWPCPSSPPPARAGCPRPAVARRPALAGPDPRWRRARRRARPHDVQGPGHLAPDVDGSFSRSRLAFSSSIVLVGSSRPSRRRAPERTPRHSSSGQTKARSGPPASGHSLRCRASPGLSWPPFRSRAGRPVTTMRV